MKIALFLLWLSPRFENPNLKNTLKNYIGFWFLKPKHKSFEALI
jgi:hypothetical protein